MQKRIFISTQEAQRRLGFSYNATLALAHRLDAPVVWYGNRCKWDSSKLEEFAHMLSANQAQIKE